MASGGADRFDVAVVGGGIVGLATARQFLERFPDLRLVLVEKESRVAAHQTGHNSGVVHSGLYYAPGSAKARTAVTGGLRMAAYCQERGLPLETCGKLVVATSEAEIPALAELHRRGRENGVPDLSFVGPERLREIEPHARGVQALHVPHASITDYVAVARSLAGEIVAAGGELRLGWRVERFTRDAEGHRLESSTAALNARYLVTCAGLHSDRVARRAGADPEARILPFRGDYFEIRPERRHLVRGLIYPVPDPRFPFLGVHFTRLVGGRVEAGPNAVLALAREGYRKLDLDLRDALETAGFAGFWRLAANHWRTGLAELQRAFSKAAFTRSLQRLVPEIEIGDLQPAPSGVRAQAVRPDGRLVDDFLVAGSWQALHVLNAPSPAATASLAIAEEVVREAAARFEMPTAR